MGLLDKFFNSDKKILNEVERAVIPVDALKDQMAALSDEQLREKTVEFRKRLDDGETLMIFRSRLLRWQEKPPEG